MIIALLADIHANIFALRRVLDDCADQKVEQFAVLGDSIGYYYWPAEVVTVLKSINGATIVQGNHERMLGDCLNAPNHLACLEKRYQGGMQSALNDLDSDQKDFLLSLPPTSRVTIDDIDCLFSHGSPYDPDCYIYPDASNELLDKCTETGAEFVFTAHTHYPFVCSRNGCMIVNPGSVGQPRDFGTMASYAVLNTGNRTIVNRRIDFDFEKLLTKATETNDPNSEYLHLLKNRGGRMQ